jgi:hypothetical protein
MSSTSVTGPPDKKGDYDPVFLDWVFWWFLGTFELTDRLLARQAAH